MQMSSYVWKHTRKFFGNFAMHQNFVRNAEYTLDRNHPKKGKKVPSSIANSEIFWRENSNKLKYNF